MGLDISFTSKLGELLTTDVDEGDELWIANDEQGLAGPMHVYVNPDFASRADGLEDGYYSIPDGAITGSFRAGSYSGYNEWRNELSKMATGKAATEHWHADGGGPFWELIHFSDCEGAIGPRTSAKLREDFLAFESKAKKWGRGRDDRDDGWFYRLYEQWKAAFYAAAQGGVVSFH